MAKHIGIVACSAEGAALCYRTICVEGATRMGRHAHPEISMHTYCLADYMKAIDVGNWEAVADLMVASAEKVASLGATIAISPDNTIHQAFSYVSERSPIPWLHIAQEVATEATRRSFQCLAVLGTRYLMEGPVYPEKLSASGLDYRIPNAEERERLNQIIFDELVYGRFTEEARAYFQSVIVRLHKDGCDAVVLGCTEIPLLISDETSPLPTLDSTRLLARAALRHSLETNAS